MGDFSGRPSKTVWPDATGGYGTSLSWQASVVSFFCLLVFSPLVYFFFFFNEYKHCYQGKPPTETQGYPGHQRAWGSLLLIRMWAQLDTQFFSLQLLLRIYDNRREQWYKMWADPLSHWWLNPGCSSVYEKESVLVTQSCPTLCDPMDCM